MMHPVKGLNTEGTAERDESRMVCSANLIHQTDRIVRKLVNKEMERFKSRLLLLQCHLKVYKTVITVYI